jgi:DNA-binding NarL/FixJ family response regulator
MAQGRDNAQIAASMGLSEKTVRNHITSVFAKLEVERIRFSSQPERASATLRTSQGSHGS